MAIIVADKAQVLLYLVCFERSVAVVVVAVVVAAMKNSLHTLYNPE